MLICSPYKFFGPHMGLAFGREELIAAGGRTRCDPPPDEPVGRRFELGTCQHELLAGFVAAVDYVDSIGWEAITAHERALGERFLAGLPDERRRSTACRRWTGRVPTFCFNVPGRTVAGGRDAPRRAHDVAVWWGNYYALETMRRLGLDEWMGAVRAGIVHYNTAEEVDRLLAGLAELVVRLLAARRPEVPSGGRCIDAALARGHERDALQPRADERRSVPRARAHLHGDRDGGLDGLGGREWDAVVDTSGLLPARRAASARSCCASAVGHYVFVSSISVYAVVRRRVDEDSAARASSTSRARGHRRSDVRPAQGALRARRSKTRSRDRATVVRPGLIVGPHDPTGRFTYWPHRLARGGEILGPGPPGGRVQFIDVRDLAAWIVACRRARLAGAFNATGAGDDGRAGRRRRARSRARPRAPSRSTTPSSPAHGRRRVDGAAALGRRPAPCGGTASRSTCRARSLRA